MSLHVATRSDNNMPEHTNKTRSLDLVDTQRRNHTNDVAPTVTGSRTMRMQECMQYYGKTKQTLQKMAEMEDQIFW